MRALRTEISKTKRTAAVVFALGLCLTLFTPFAPLAQRAKERQGANVTGVSTRPTERGAVVSITGDAPLTRAQTWQDEEGFHIVGYNWTMKSGTPRGVKVRRVGDSLEMIVPVRRGGSVSVHPRSNSLDIVVNGELRQPGADAEPARAVAARASERIQSGSNAATSDERAARRTTVRVGDAAKETPQVENSARAKTAAKNSQASRQATTIAQPTATGSPERQAARESQPAAETAPAVMPAEQFQNNFAENTLPADTMPAATAEPVAAQTGAAAATDATSEGGTGSSVLTTLVAAALLFGLLFGFLFLRSRRQGDAGVAENAVKVEEASATSLAVVGGANAVAKTAASNAKDEEMKLGEAKSSVAAPESQSLARRSKASFSSSAVPPVLFGAVRVEQEIAKLVRGEAHSVEVLASRASDDRRAVETSLIKAISSRSLTEAERERARRALEEYGFVARQSAALLGAPGVFERSSAARALGSIRSASSLPFLLEALYDGEPVVRAEAVASLGSLGLPSAIGALIDLARRHPDIPPQLLGNALSACSVDCIDLGGDGRTFGLAGDGFTGEIAGFEPVAEVEQLPEWFEDETLAEALERFGSTDVEARVAAAQQLSLFRVTRSVEALSAMAAGDPDAAVRAAAVTGLGLIGHESVFAPVLISMADEAREVRAAAARALSRLGFDRADAYVRVQETSDDETLRRVTDACVSAGLARQALDRLASDDRRQAYEAFSLLSLVARGGQVAVILEAVESHADVNIRIASARLLALQGEREVAARLRRIASDQRTPEKLRAAIGEIVSRGEQHATESAVPFGD